MIIVKALLKNFSSTLKAFIFKVLTLKIEIMSLLNKSDIKNLLSIHGEPCVSIFIPTERAGQNVLNEKNKLHLKSQLKEVEKGLVNQKASKDVISKISDPIQKLIDDTNFWRHQSDGLAVFASENFFKIFTLPVNFEAYHYVSNEFYIKPLVPMLNDDERFYILALQLQEVTLYEATRYTIGEVEVEDLIPSRLEERVGFDYKEKHLSFRSQNSGGEKTIFHGHGGGGGDERKDEITRYFRAIDKGLESVLTGDKAPLIVATQDYLFPLYKDANNYNNLYEEVLPGNPSEGDLFDLHEKALRLIEPLLRKKRNDKAEAFNKHNKTEKTGTSITDILPAIQQGKVDTLFLENQNDIWGHYNKNNMKTILHDKQQADNYSLMNWAAKEVLSQGGHVFLTPKAQMPDTSSKVNALYRFS